MSRKCTVRRVNADEHQALHDISISTFTDTYAIHNTPENMANYIDKSFDVEQLRDELTSENSYYFFAEYENVVVGYLKLNTGAAQTNKSTPNACEIERIYVNQEHQGLKIGRHLFQTAVDFASNARCDWVWLGVWDQNKKAIGFYEKMGFEVFGRHDFKLGTEDQSDLLMRLRTIDA